MGANSLRTPPLAVVRTSLWWPSDLKCNGVAITPLWREKDRNPHAGSRIRADNVDSLFVRGPGPASRYLIRTDAYVRRPERRRTPLRRPQQQWPPNVCLQQSTFGGGIRTPAEWKGSVAQRRWRRAVPEWWCTHHWQWWCGLAGRSLGIRRGLSRRQVKCNQAREGRNERS
jgi:hypothetical protein